MELQFFIKALWHFNQYYRLEMGRPFSKLQLQDRGQSGEILLPVACFLMAGTFLIASLVWLGQHFEIKTKEHLNEFRKEWNALEQKYKK